MGLFDFFGSGKRSAMRLYKRGMDKANKRDTEGAIADYSAVLDLTSAPEDVQSMARLNRALVYSATKDYTRAIDELKALIDTPTTPANVKTTAQEKLARMQKRVGSEGKV